MLVAGRVRVDAQLDADVGKAVVDGDRHWRARFGAFLENWNRDGVGEHVRSIVNVLGGQVETDAQRRSGISGSRGSGVGGLNREG
jgi:hypothetical protein